MQERLFTAYQIADLLDTTPREVAQWIQSGRLQARPLPGGTMRVSEQQLVTFLKQEGVDLEQIMTQVSQGESSAEATVAASVPQGVYQQAAGPVASAPVASAAGEPAETDRPSADATARAVPQLPPPETIRVEPVAADVVAETPNTDAEDAEDADDVQAPSEMPESPPDDAAEQLPAPAPGASASAPAAAARLEPAAAEEERPAPRPTPRAKARRSSGKRKAPARVAADAPPPAGPADQVIQAIVADAVVRGASAVHLERRGPALHLHLRLGGLLHEKPSFERRLPKGLGPELVAQLTSRANFFDCDSVPGSSAPAAAARFGEFEIVVQGKPMRVGLSAVATVAGERIVLRILEPAVAAGDLAAIGFSPEAAAEMNALLAAPHGLILAACPPRNDLDRTLRTAAAHLADDRAVFCLERRQDVSLQGVAHCICGGPRGLEWSQAVSAAVAQDADAIVVADICDPRVAIAAVEAAADGALVCAGVRSDTAAGAIDTFTKMGVDPWAVASTLRGVLAQRTVRTLCDECKKRMRATARALASIGMERREVDFPLFEPRSCGRCGGVGYLGQAMLASVRRIDESHAEKIRRGLGGGKAIGPGSADLFDAALAHLRAGTTTVAELVRARLKR